MIMAPGFSRPDQWQVQIQAQIQLHARVLLKSDCLSEAQIRGARCEPVGEMGEAVAELLALSGTSLCVLPHGPQTIPYLS